ncbi:hypothetical protein IMZ48_23055, partial [Candidatus Bathyarchaeota archaeon]|nr:hypothetical protein [Candidatus Bathyarchaeota archaeon]
MSQNYFDEAAIDPMLIQASTHGRSAQHIAQPQNLQYSAPGHTSTAGPNEFFSDMDTWGPEKLAYWISRYLNVVIEKNMPIMPIAQLYALPPRKQLDYLMAIVGFIEVPPNMAGDHPNPQTLPSTGQLERLAAIASSEARMNVAGAHHTGPRSALATFRDPKPSSTPARTPLPQSSPGSEDKSALCQALALTNPVVAPRGVPTHAPGIPAKEGRQY